MNILKKKVSYSYEPDFKKFNEFIQQIKNANKQSAVLLMHRHTLEQLIVDQAYNDHPYITYYSYQGIKVAEANWLDIGEVVLVNEVQID